MSITMQSFLPLTLFTAAPGCAWRPIHHFRCWRNQSCFRMLEGAQPDVTHEGLVDRQPRGKAQRRDHQSARPTAWCGASHGGCRRAVPGQDLGRGQRTERA